MKKFFYTIFANIYYAIKNLLPTPLIITAAVTIIMICIIVFNAKKNGENAKQALKRNAPRVCSSSLFTLYLSLILNATVLKRLSEPKYDPFSDILGNWIITEQQYTCNTDPLWNTVMFLPFCTLLYLFLKYALKKTPGINRLLLISGISGFLLSAVIETLQIILKAGTFQLSDLFYNTLGAVLSVPLYLLLAKAARAAHNAYLKKHSAKNK